MYDLRSLGYDRYFRDFAEPDGLAGCVAGRIVAQYRERYSVQTESGISAAEITGKLRYSASGSQDFPVVGDWVYMMAYDDLCLIHQILPRKTVLERKAVGKSGETQTIAANIDYAMIVQSLDLNFNINRLERYISVSYEGRIEPVLVLNKKDLVSEDALLEKLDLIGKRIGKIPCLATSIISGEGIGMLKDQFIPGKTYCFIGSSGVGKSSLINEVAGRNLMQTGNLSGSTNKGKHTTSHRELIVLDNGGILIDTPGMRELGITGTGVGVKKTFSQIEELAASCKFVDCTHSTEPGCALQVAIVKGIIDRSELDHFLKLEREARHFERSKSEKRSRDKKFGRLYKEVIKRKDKSRGS